MNLHRNSSYKSQVAAILVGAALVASGAALAAGPASTSGELDALHWRSIGPYSGGRVTSVSGNASEPGKFYAAYAGGGVWVTDDYGVHWKDVFPTAGITADSAGAVAVAPSNPKIIYVGTGDPAPRNTFLTGNGMYKSVDGGKTWKHIGLAVTHIISWILVDPKNPDIVYAAALGHVWGPNAERGVFKSTNGGETWKKVLFVNDDTGAITMAMDPSNPSVLYATMWEMFRKPWTFSSGGPGSGLFKSTNGGETWTNITHNSGLPTGIWGKAGVAVAPSNPDVLYVLVQATLGDGSPGGLFQSTDGGATWKLINDSLAITQRAFYYMRVYVDPKDANTIYLPNVNVFVSHDAGKTLHKLSPPHGDNHAFWIDPANPKLLIEGNDGGATVSLTGGKSWSTEFNQPTGQFYHVHVDDQFPYHVWGAQQDRNAVESPNAVAAGGIPGRWKTVVGGEMSWPVPEPGKPWISYGTGYFGVLERDDRRTGLRTNVSPWPADLFGHKAAQLKYRSGWWHQAVVNIPSEPNALLVGANQLLETTDGGLTWKAISPDLTRDDKSKQQRPGGPISADVTSEENFDTISTIGVSTVNPKIIWTGSDDGLVYVTENGGANWSQVRPPQLPEWSTITTVEPSHRHPGTAFVSASRFGWDDFHPYVYKTSDFGKTWTPIIGGLPDDQYVTSIRQDPDDPSLLFAGTSATVYVSFDEGGHWQALTRNLPAVRVTDIAIQPQQHAVAISTFGRGFWTLDNLQFLEQLAAAHVAPDAPYLFKPQQAWLLTRSTGGFGSHTRTGNAGTNLAPGTTVFFHLPANYSGRQTVKLSFEDASGKLVRSFTLPVKPEAPQVEKSVVETKHPKVVKLHPGMNRFQWDLRYAPYPDIHGIFNTFFSAAKPIGPQVLPGTYYATLTYDGHSQKQAFEVKLDPRLDTTQAELQQRFDLQMQLFHTLTTFNTTVNEALAARSALQKEVASGKVAQAKAEPLLANLDRDIGSAVNLKIQSNEGALVFPPQIRSWLSTIYGEVSTALVAPTASMQQVAAMYIADANKAAAALKSDIAAAHRPG